MANNVETEDSSESLGDLIENVGDLPTLPTVVVKIAAMTSNPQTNAADVGRLISNDPTLSSKILKLVNSAYYGFPGKINNVTKAIVLLGFNKVKNIALSASVADAFKKVQKSKHFDFYRFWEHSVAVAICSEVTARRTHPQAADDAFVSGLLQDIGKVVMVSFIEETPKCFEDAKTRRITFQRACEETLGYDHARVGALLAEHWNFPETLSRCIRFAPCPEKTRQSREVIACTHVANVLVSALGYPAAGDHAMPLVSGSAWDELKLNEDAIEAICKETLHGLANASAFLELAK